MATAARPAHSRPLLVLTGATTLVAWPLALVAWRATRQPGLALSLFGLGLSLGPCLAAFALARPSRKQAWRRTVMATGGAAILTFSLLDAVSVDLEGFFALLLLGTMGAAIGHTMVTTIAGPLLFGRVLCGWGCWRAMVLEQLPIAAGSGVRKTGWWAKMPLAGLALSATGGALMVALHVDPAGTPGRLRGESVVHVAAAVGVYYALSVALAFALGDQRAFCKYLCPSGQILRWTSRRSLLAIRSRAALCTDCGACTRTCPMDVDVAAAARAGGRIGGGDCILCQRCVTACASGALRMGVSA